MELKDELAALEKELAGLYLGIADVYKRMSKIKDNYRLNTMQSGTDAMTVQIAGVRTKIDARGAEIARQLSAPDTTSKTKYN